MDNNELTSEELQLLRKLLVALTKAVGDNIDASSNNGQELNKNTSYTLEGRPVFASFHKAFYQGDTESSTSGISLARELAPATKNEKNEATVDMWSKHEAFLRYCDGLEYEVRSTSFIGDTHYSQRSENGNSRSQDWVPNDTYRMRAQARTMHKSLSSLADASLQLKCCLSEYEHHHGLLLQEFQEWEWSLRDGVIGITLCIDEKDFEGLNVYIFQTLMPVLSRYMERITKQLQALSPLTLPPLQSAENNATSRYLNMTTIATFFSGVTATTLQFSIPQSTATLNSAVTLFWLLSLVFSVASAINSLLGMTWRKSSIAPPSFRLPRWASVWLDIAPMVFLFISAFAFAIGLALFPFASQQSTFVSTFITAFIVLHILELFLLSVWFLSELEKDSIANMQKFIGRLALRSSQKDSNRKEGLPTTAGRTIPSRSARVYERVFSTGKKIRRNYSLCVKGIQSRIASLFVRRKSAVSEGRLETAPTDASVGKDPDSDVKNPGLAELSAVQAHAVERVHTSYSKEGLTSSEEKCGLNVGTVNLCGLNKGLS